VQTRILNKEKRSEVRTFKSFPFSLYRGNPYWVPPLPGEIERVMNPAKHPFYSHSEADFIIVESKREILGRLAILHNRNYCSFHHEKTAFFYYFESIDDPQVAENLIDAAQDWARERGLSTIQGARGFLRSSGIGILVDGFETMPAMGIPYNLPYYGKLLESCGFAKAYDHYSGILEKHPDQAIHKIAEKVLSRGNFYIRDFQDVAEIEPWISKIDDLHHKAFADNPSYYPSTAQEFALLSHDILSIADPKYIKLIMHNDDIAGFILAYPDVNRSIQRCRGHLFPFGWMLILSEKRSPRVIDLNGVGLLPEYQGLGGNVLLYAELDKVIRNPKIKRAEVVQVDERNFRSKSDMQNLGVALTKTHRTYQKTI
jgi:hypothetical protein